MEKERLVSIQKELKKRLVLEDGFSKIEIIGGSDVHYTGKNAYCTIALFNYRDMKPVGVKTTRSKVTFPYVPGFLSFREAPPIIETYKSLDENPDVLLIDGHGIAHPRGIGLASHVGALLDLPTIGVAKKILVGGFSYPEKVGDASKIVFDGRHVGFALKTRDGSRPVFISPGHKVSLNSSLELVKRCLKGHRLPEPLRRAHILSREAASKKS